MAQENLQQGWDSFVKVLFRALLAVSSPVGVIQNGQTKFSLVILGFSKNLIRFSHSENDYLKNIGFFTCSVWRLRSDLQKSFSWITQLFFNFYST